MIADVKSKQGACFLPSEIISEMIKTIETLLPGWWWSISQKDVVSITVGPGRNSPSLIDVELSKTKGGDAGYTSVSHLTEIYNRETLLKGWFHPFLHHVDSKRSVIKTTHVDLINKTQSFWFRHQTDRALNCLKTEYDKFLQDVSMIESHGCVLKELYLGSCDLSIDCSIRGIKEEDNSDFDITVDIVGDGYYLSESVEQSLSELKNDILTPSRKGDHD